MVIRTKIKVVGTKTNDCGNKNMVEGTKTYCVHKNIGCGNKNKMVVGTNLWLWE
jgi:hypothetical protein